MTKHSPACGNVPGTAHEALSEGDLVAYVGLLKALGHPVRLRMVDLIHRQGGELCVCEFEHHVDLAQPTISHHLKVLREAGLIRSAQDGSWVHHFIVPETFARVRRLVETFTDLPERA